MNQWRDVGKKKLGEKKNIKIMQIYVKIIFMQSIFSIVNERRKI